MYKINPHYAKLQGSYLFSAVAQKQHAFSEAHPDREVIRLSIGDVTQPLAPAVIAALHDAVDEMAHAETFHGYAPDLGYSFLREAVVENDYRPRGCEVYPDEVFISDGAKCDVGNIQELFVPESKIAVCDPVYPVYVDSNVMAGRTGACDPATGKFEGVIYMPCTKENDFKPEIPDEIPDLIYLCFPNNPIGTVLTKDELQVWVDYAKSVGAVILFDAAYEAFIEDPEIPHSIYECEGARDCAIEFRSYSKTAGFTGVRLAYTVIPKNMADLHDMWARRHGTKYNGAPYIIQKAAMALYTPEGKRQIMDTIAYYKRNAKIIYDGMTEAGYRAVGGINSPYIWVEVPEGMTSWGFFDKLLNETAVVCTPGSGFGPSGEGYIRLTAFGDHEKTIEAVERIKAMSR